MPPVSLASANEEGVVCSFDQRANGFAAWRRRVMQGLRSAAKRGEIFHLWWHPHNFGVELEANIAGLEAILDEFERLRESQGMQSLNMGEVLELMKIRGKI